MNDIAGFLTLMVLRGLQAAIFMFAMVTFVTGFIG